MPSGGLARPGHPRSPIVAAKSLAFTTTTSATTTTHTGQERHEEHLKTELHHERHEESLCTELHRL